MYGIFIASNGFVLRVASQEDRIAFLNSQWHELSDAAISDAGMSVYESFVGPHNTSVAKYGSIVFIPPPPPTEEDLFTQLGAARDAKLTATDKYLLPDYPISADALSAVKAYRQTLRDLPGQEGAPWDGGGELTPWPELPAVQGV
ncbi:tail fiber assembly protein [uncultured Desulfovibrio sp.]|uniref:tail fiber assembly protein n=1 Tax=uncultured Desulfovibrio sp. TaxID=167968 RepID=UPI00266C7B6F|nr:tail fiber assembly protein [uncultured Desulfovibrio sp.]